MSVIGRRDWPRIGAPSTAQHNRTVVNRQRWSNLVEAGIPGI
jgi:hypothetical protein